MSLYIPPLYERTPVYHEDGSHAGYIVRQRGLRPGEVLEPVSQSWDPDEDTLTPAIQMAKEACDAIRYD